MFHYDEWDRKVYWLTRQLKGLTINREQYTRVFNSTLNDDFGPIIQMLQRETLLSESLSLSIQGRYFADAISGLLVDYIYTQKRPAQNDNFGYEQLRAIGSMDLRRGNDARRYHMG